ncbi:MAG: L-rhamnose isomerase [Verrucomicrobia bacterium]|nr:L-rhamnose isomerase [Verrucomicrobiota bacterium]
MTEARINSDLIASLNEKAERSHRKDFEALHGVLSRRGIQVEQLISTLSNFTVAVPSWGFGQGGTRFGRFPVPGEPTNLAEKMFDAAVVNDLAGLTPRVSLHIPWDKPEDPKSLIRLAKSLGLGFDAMNSNTFQDQPGQNPSYKFGSLSHTDRAVRRHAIEHNIECIEIGRALGSKALTVWLADGGSFPGQQNLRRALDRVIESLQDVYLALPSDWRIFTEHKPFEPAFYSTVVQDWGTSLMIAQAMGKQAACLVDLGHHLPNTNIEQVVARLIAANRLGGFHFNDSKFADDDLSAGSIRPYQLFLVFNELADAALDRRLQRNQPKQKPSLMIDQSHNLKDPLEDLMLSAIEIHRAYAKALLVDRTALNEFQESNDVVMAERTLKIAYETDVSPLLAEVRRRRGAAIDPVAVFRRSKYRAQKARERRSGAGTRAGIV